MKTSDERALKWKLTGGRNYKAMSGELKKCQAACAVGSI